MDEITEYMSRDGLIAAVILSFLSIGIVEYIRDRLKERNKWKNIGRW